MEIEKDFDLYRLIAFVNEVDSGYYNTTNITTEIKKATQCSFVKRKEALDYLISSEAFQIVLVTHEAKLKPAYDELKETFSHSYLDVKIASADIALNNSGWKDYAFAENNFRTCVEYCFEEGVTSEVKSLLMKQREAKVEDFLKMDFISLKDKYQSQEELEDLLISFVNAFLDTDTLVIFLVKLESATETSKLLISICKKMLLDKNKIFAFYAKRTLESIIYMMNYHAIQDEELTGHEHYGDRIADTKLRSRRNSIARTPDRYCYKSSGKN